MASLKVEYDIANRRLLEVKRKADVKRFHDLTQKVVILKKCLSSLRRQLEKSEQNNFLTLATCC